MSKRSTTAVDRPKCGAKTRAGRTCRHNAGERTTHPGKGKCWMHGGTKPGDPRVKHGMDSKVERTTIASLKAQHEQNPDPLNLLGEVALLRALIDDYIARYEAHREALLAWHASWQLTRRPLPEEQLMAFEAVVNEWENALALEGENGTEKQRGDLETARAFVQLLRGTDVEQRPKQLLDMTAVHVIIDTLSKVVARIETARAANAISRAEFYRLAGQMGRVVKESLEKHLPDPAVAEVVRLEIVAGWNALAF